MLNTKEIDHNVSLALRSFKQEIYALHLIGDCVLRLAHPDVKVLMDIEDDIKKVSIIGTSIKTVGNTKIHVIDLDTEGISLDILQGAVVRNSSMPYIMY